MFIFKQSSIYATCIDDCTQSNLRIFYRIEYQSKMPVATNISSGFRQDINGLRAWAVGIVIFYHFNLPGFSGGFIGVDIFFVLSGFLMTGIIVEGLEKRDVKFSIFSFYLARAKRILPALISLCAALLVLGWFFLTPIDYKTLGTHTAFSLTFLSNIQYWREAGYFDAASHEKWLLHTWSLAVEWQFYILFPLLLSAAWKWKPARRPVIAIIAIGLVASYFLSVALTPRAATAAFYLLPTRAWEMLAGSLVYLLGNTLLLSARTRVVLEIAGLSLIVGAIFGFDASSPWPGWRALMPIAGTVAVLIAARANSIWTCSITTQWLGTRSYSLYLWHWPVVVALTYTNLQGNPHAIATGLVLTLLLGHLSVDFHLEVTQLAV